PIRVDLPSSTEPQVSRRSKEAAIYFTVIPAKAGTSGQEVSAGLHEVPACAGMTMCVPPMSKITLPFLALHRGGLVLVDQPPGALRAAVAGHFREDFVDCLCRALERAGAGPAADRPDADAAGHGGPAARGGIASPLAADPPRAGARDGRPPGGH